MKLSTKIILPIILISALLILLAGCFGVPTDEEPGYTPGTITGVIAAPCCSTSADQVSAPSGVSPEYWCFYCQKTWYLQDGVEVILTYGEDEVATTTTNQYGEFTFTDVPPGKNYVITAYCPDFDDNRPLVKDVALELIEGGSFDTKITDLVSTSLGLVVDFLVYYTEWGPEDISLDDVIANKPYFYGFPRFKKLIIEVRRVLEDCGNVDTDEDVQDALCEAAEEISGLDIGCGPGYTPGPGPTPTVYYDLNMAVSPEDVGTTIPAVGTHTYSSGTVVPISASPADGYKFDYWSGAVTGSTNPTSVTMNANKTVTANFKSCYDNEPPTIDSITPGVIYVGEEYLGQINVTDDGTITEYELMSGPKGMVIDASTGELSGWTPSCDDICPCPKSKGDPCVQTKIKVKVIDDCDVSVEASFCIEVKNYPPYFTSTPVNSVISKTGYYYDANATDPEGHTLTYAKGKNWPADPDWLDLDTSTGEISGIAPCCDGGKSRIDPYTCYFDVEVNVSDECNTVTQSFTIKVYNEPPHFTSPPVHHAIGGTSYYYDANATDPEGHTLTYAKGKNWPADPDWLDLDTSTGEISGIAPCCEGNSTCFFDVEVNVSDECNTVTQSFELEVENHLPYFTSSAPDAIGGTSYYYDANATDPEGHILTYSKGTDWPDWLDLDTSTGEISGIAPCCDEKSRSEPSTTCSFDVEVNVLDECSTVPQKFEIKVENYSPQIVSIPITMTELGKSYEYNVSASDFDSKDLSFSLGAHPSNMTIFKTGFKTATINWTVTCGDEQKNGVDLCDYQVQVKVSDECSEYVQSYLLTVEVY